MIPLNSVEPALSRVDRRRAVQWMLAAVSASVALAKLPANAGVSEFKPTPKGYGTDPLLAKNYVPGDFWPLSLTNSQRTSAAVICDILFPADAVSPSASSLHVHDFIDEWISAPYEQQASDRQPILDCIAWFEAESEKRFRLRSIRSPKDSGTPFVTMLLMVLNRKHSISRLKTSVVSST